MSESGVTSETTFSITTLAQRPDLQDAVSRLHGDAWPAFQSHGGAVQRYWSRLYTAFPQMQFAIIDQEQTVVAAGNSVPLQCDGTLAALSAGWDDAVKRAFAPDAPPPNTLCALAAVVCSDHQGTGLSARIITEMKEIAARRGFHSLIAPVRPTLKAMYPLTPIERYTEWRTPNGDVFDPWLRVHLRLGGVVLRPAPQSMVIEGSIAEWQGWTGMAFPESGAYIVPGALSPVEIDVTADRGFYVEPNIWVVHRHARSVGASQA
jgi:hypothetical protein